MQATNGPGRIDQKRSTLNCSSNFLARREFTGTHDLDSTRGREQNAGNQPRAPQRGDSLPIHNSQPDRLEVRIEVAAVHGAQAVFASHDAAEFFALRIIDDAQRAGFGRENCKMYIDPPTGCYLFNSNVPMLNSAATRIRFN